jgi:predicted RNA binding protein YcfA (HicA-like mRNA interferase family)
MAPQGLRPLPYRKMARRLKDFGFRPERQRGSHVTFLHPDGRMVNVPHHAREELSKGFVLALIHQAGIDPDEFLAAFR